MVLIVDSCMSGKPQGTKKVHWPDDKIGPLDEVFPKTQTAGLDQDGSEISSSRLKANLLGAQKRWIKFRTPMPRFILPPDKGHCKVVVQEIQHEIEGYESTLRELADLYVKEQTFDDERWERTQIDLLKSQRAEIFNLVSSEGAHLDYQRSWILPKLQQALNILRFPVFQQNQRRSSIREQAIQQIIYYQHLDKEHLGKTKWNMRLYEFTDEEAGALCREVTRCIGMSRSRGPSWLLSLIPLKIARTKAKDEWLSSQTPIPSEVAQLDPLHEQQKRWETAKASRANLLRFANSGLNYLDCTLYGWQTALLDSQQAMFIQIPTTAHYERSVALRLLLEGLKIFLFPVYQMVKHIVDVKAAAMEKIIYYQKVLEDRHGIIDWEKCSDDPKNFTDEKAHQLLEKVEELLKSNPDSGKE
ncbi:hypothetical protein H0H93_014363 [Arthromyces matolae]|nr:hypothetical protein H0H93_014363 [Arthromyces matolae]